MQDKDFDRILKERFEALEIQPSASSWNKITAHLDQKPKKKKALPSYWMAAASVILLASAVLWLYKPVEVVKLHPEGQVSKAVEKTIQPGENTLLRDEANKSESVPVATNSSVRAAKLRVFAASKSRSVQLQRPKRETSVQLINREKPNDQVLIAKQETVVPADLPKPLTITDDNTTRLADADDEKAEDAPEHESRHKIKSIGSLVNFVVAQVDKRENKIIEFKDGEEGSEVSGINLGPLKFKSRNK
jgi:hypothetical protein